MQNLLQYVLPHHCALCTLISKQGICDACRTDYFPSNRVRCLQCGIPLNSRSDNRCGACLKEPPHFDRTLVSCDYLAPVDSLVLGLKFGRDLRYAKLIAEQLESIVIRHFTQTSTTPHIFCPVPLSRQRLIARGFNQSLEIAKNLKLPPNNKLAPNLVWRLKETLQQSSLHPDDRYHNVRGAFFTNPECREEIDGKHLVVVDDVITTGTTLNEIARVLKQAGAISVSNLVFARTTWH
ncbi:ComF family protein [Undibacterium sp.]|uniref:ComF family protein n=1 Tax=Undibacterium sp. TaxID=1914977 RepID=UPI003753823E